MIRGVDGEVLPLLSVKTRAPWQRSMFTVVKEGALLSGICES